MSKRDSILLLEDMLESVQKIKRYTIELDYEAFLSDDKSVDAVVRNFEIIGEAANRLDQEFRNSYPELNGTGFGDFGTESYMIISGLTIVSFGKLLKLIWMI